MSQKKIRRICALIMGFSGLVILFSSLYPIFSYEWQSSQRYPILISPLVDKEKASFKFDERDYTKLSNWFEEEQKLVDESTQGTAITYYTLSIPKLGIDNALVKLGGEDLSDSLIQYPGTAIPGKVGNAVIFGHSVLPQYFDPKNYLTIFSTLPRLEIGDLIYINYNDFSYSFQVEDIFEVRPKDIQILEQSSSGAYITLVTCTPPGHPLKPKRLIIRAKLLVS